MVQSIGGGVSMAKQPEDDRTLELPLCGPESISVTKRGPGRPRDPNALTNAERQQRFMDKKKRLKRNGPMPAMYQCPLTGKVWSGRGLRPKWLAVAVAEGNPLWMYLVKR